MAATAFGDGHLGTLPVPLFSDQLIVAHPRYGTRLGSLLLIIGCLSFYRGLLFRNLDIFKPEVDPKAPT